MMVGGRDRERLNQVAGRLGGFFRLLSFQLAALSKILHVQIECNFLK